MPPCHQRVLALIPGQSMYDFGRQSSTGIGFCLRTSVFPCWYHSIITPHSFSHLSQCYILLAIRMSLYNTHKHTKWQKRKQYIKLIPCNDLNSAKSVLVVGHLIYDTRRRNHTVTVQGMNKPNS